MAAAFPVLLGPQVTVAAQVPVGAGLCVHALSAQLRATPSLPLASDDTLPVVPTSLAGAPSYPDTSQRTALD